MILGDWISVADRLPAVGKDVLVGRPGEEAVIACLLAAGDWGGGYSWAWDEAPTHWMELPSPPKAAGR